METGTSIPALERLQREFQSGPTQASPSEPESDPSSGSVARSDSGLDAKRRHTKSKGSRSEAKLKKRSKHHDPRFAVRAPNTPLESADMIGKHLMRVLRTDSGAQLRSESEEIKFFFWSIETLLEQLNQIDSKSPTFAESVMRDTSIDTVKHMEYSSRKLASEIGVQQLTTHLLSAYFVPKLLPRSLSGNQKEEISPREHIDHRKRSKSESIKKGRPSPSTNEQAVSSAVMTSITKLSGSKSDFGRRNESPRASSVDTNSGRLSSPNATVMPSLPHKPSLIIPSRAESEPLITREAYSSSPESDSKDSESERALITTQPLILPGIISPDMPKPEVVRRAFRRENSKNDSEANHQQTSATHLLAEAGSTPPLPASPLSGPTGNSSSSLISAPKPLKPRSDPSTPTAKVPSGGANAQPSDVSPNTLAHGPRRHLKRSSSDTSKPEESKASDIIDWRTPATARAANRHNELDDIDDASNINSAYARSLEERDNPPRRQEATAFSSSNNIGTLDYRLGDSYDWASTGFDDDDGTEDGNTSDGSGSSRPSSARSDAIGDVVSDDGNQSASRFVFSSLMSEFGPVFEISTWKNQVWPAFQKLDTFILSNIVYGASASRVTDSTGSGASDSKSDAISARNRSTSSSTIIRAWSSSNCMTKSPSGNKVLGNIEPSSSKEKLKSSEKSRPSTPPKKDKSKHNIESSSSDTHSKMAGGRMMSVAEWSWGVFWVLFRRYCTSVVEIAHKDWNTAENDVLVPNSPTEAGRDDKTASALPIRFDDKLFTNLQTILKYNIASHQQSEKCYELRAQHSLDFDTVNVPLDVLLAKQDKPASDIALFADMTAKIGMPILTKDDAAELYRDYFYRNFLQTRINGSDIAKDLAFIHANKYESQLKLASKTSDSGITWTTSVDFDIVSQGSSYFSPANSRSCTIL